ncbi:hypothetical protein ACFVWT_02480 [Arthrobacter sp. NPDC058288]|uniref:hypothetical protein n=1 Tax=Arthrobacter sp. NPDC058288 TaxID=3346424 RepID=UPI0036E71697
MKKILAVAAVAGLAGLTACSVSTPAPDSATSTPAPATSSSVPSRATPSASESAAASGTSGVKEACEKFNTLYAEYKAAGGNKNAYEDIYLKAEDAKGAVSGDLEGLFAALSLIAIDHSAAGGSGEPEQASKDAVRDAVFANAGACTAEGVTLTL